MHQGVFVARSHELMRGLQVPAIYEAIRVVLLACAPEHARVSDACQGRASAMLVRGPLPLQHPTNKRSTPSRKSNPSALYHFWPAYLPCSGPKNAWP